MALKSDLIAGVRAESIWLWKLYPTANLHRSPTILNRSTGCNVGPEGAPTHESRRTRQKQISTSVGHNSNLADIDIARAHGPGLRWAILCQFMNANLAVETLESNIPGASRSSDGRVVGRSRSHRTCNSADD
jgi:hypothetical protein